MNWRNFERALIRAANMVRNPQTHASQVFDRAARLFCHARLHIARTPHLGGDTR